MAAGPAELRTPARRQPSVETSALLALELFDRVILFRAATASPARTLVGAFSVAAAAISMAVEHVAKWLAFDT